MPNNANLYDSLGEAYMENESWDHALAAYTQSLALDPKNQNVKDRIQKIKDQLRKE